MRWILFSLIISLPALTQAAELERISKEVETQTLMGNTVSCEHSLGRLQSGQQSSQLSWLRCGADTGPSVIYAHGNPGSRLELFYFAETARRAGLQLWVIERPGMGDSEYIEPFGLDAYAETAIALADLEGLDQFHVMGWSSGGPPSLAVASRYPQRVRQALILSSYTDFGSYPQAEEYMRETGHPGPELADSTPRLFHGLVKTIGWLGDHLPDLYLALLKTEVSEADQTVLDHQSLAELFKANQKAAFTGDNRGVIQDLEVQWQKWPFDLASVSVPVRLWQGEQDTLVPPDFARHLAGQLPNAQLRWLSQAGHLYPLLPQNQEAFWKSLTEVAVPAPSPR